MRRITIAAVLVLSISLVASAEPGTVRLETVIPSDTEMVMIVNDVPHFLERWSESPLGRAWNDPQLKRFLGPMREAMEIDRWDEAVRGETGLELDEILGAFKGQFIMLSPNFRSLMEDGEVGIEQLGMLAHVGGSDVLRRLMDNEMESMRDELEENEKLEEITEEFLGETLHMRRKTSADAEHEQEGWAIVDGIAVMAEPKSYLQQLVGALKGQAAASSPTLVERPGFKKVLRRVPGADMMLYVDAAAFVPAMEEGIRTSFDNAEAPNPMGITAEGVLDALGLDTLQSVFMSTTLAERATQLDLGVQYAADRGIIKLLALDPGPVKPPVFLPEDAVEASVSNFSFARMWLAAKELLGAVNPAFAGMVEAQIAQLSAAHGIDIEKGVFGSLGNQVFSAKYLRPVDEPGATPSLEVLDQLVGISVVDRQSLEMGLEALKNLVGAFGGGVDLFETTEYLGHTVFTMKQELPGGEGAPPQRWAYALAEDYLLMSTGTQVPLKAAIARRGKPGPQLWSRPEVKRATKALPPDASGLSFYDTEKMLRTFIESCSVLNALMAEESDSGDSDARTLCDPSAKPDPSTVGRFFGPTIGAQYKEAGGFYATVRLIHPER